VLGHRFDAKKGKKKKKRIAIIPEILPELITSLPILKRLLSIEHHGSKTPTDGIYLVRSLWKQYGGSSEN